MDKNRILIIEDEASIRELLAMNLEAVGYEVDLAGTVLRRNKKSLQTKAYMTWPWWM